MAREDAVERAVGEGQIECVALDELGVRSLVAGDLEHRLALVEAGDLAGEKARDEAGAAGHVEGPPRRKARTASKTAVPLGPPPGSGARCVEAALEPPVVVLVSACVVVRLHGNLRVRKVLPLESVPNFSEGRDRGTIDAIGEALATGARLLDVHSDPDHNRSVFTLVADDAGLVNGLVAGVECARERIDLRHHEGAHPWVGAADVVPLVPIAPADMERARAAAPRSRVASANWRCRCSCTEDRGAGRRSSGTAGRASSSAG